MFTIQYVNALRFLITMQHVNALRFLILLQACELAYESSFESNAMAAHEELRRGRGHSESVVFP